MNVPPRKATALLAASLALGAHALRTAGASVAATQAEREEPRAGDDLVAPAEVVMDRAFSVPGTPAQVWPWLQQLGKQRAGWYLSRRLERLVPRGRRAARTVEPRWQHLVVGDDIPDYGGPHEKFTVALLQAPHILVYTSLRGTVYLSWSLVLRAEPTAGGPARTRVLLRLRMAPVKRRWLARSGGELIDVLTVAAMAGGLRERLADEPRGAARPA
ncbi:hypothetical protein [Streptomyces sp. NPDC101237]|uniref:hypothetical protein n=1 Tax=Streptomyces sp. NPDC101237 TaxID=3366139 RepID=UPI00380DFF0A